jgi:DNA primase
MASFVDFAELKTRVSIEQAAKIVGLQLTPHQNQFRAPCTACNSGGPRAIVITPDKSLFFCFAAKVGGDAIALASHIKNVSQKAAALLLDGQASPGTVLSTSTVKGTVPQAQAKKPGFDPEAYAARLDASHASLAPLGISPDTLKDWKAGYSNSGTNRGRLAIALHDREGTVIGFGGRALGDEQPKMIIPNGIDPKDIIFGGERVEQGVLYLVRDVLDVLRASENGVTNCVCFLTEISAIQVEMLAALMATRQCDVLELF